MTTQPPLFAYIRIRILLRELAPRNGFVVTLATDVGQPSQQNRWVKPRHGRKADH
jgi:hypothetical protein